MVRRFLEKAQNKHDHPTPDTRNFDTRTTYDNHYTGSRTVRGFQKIEVGRSRNTAYFHKRPARILTRCESAHATCVRVHGAYRRRRRPVREVGGARGDGARRPLLTPWLVAALECTHRHFFAIGLQDSIFFFKLLSDFMQGAWSFSGVDELGMANLKHNSRCFSYGPNFRFSACRHFQQERLKD